MLMLRRNYILLTEGEVNWIQPEELSEETFVIVTDGFRISLNRKSKPVANINIMRKSLKYYKEIKTQSLSSRKFLQIVEKNMNPEYNIPGTSGFKSESQVHPPHLKGKAIGLWYAKRNREKRKALEESGCLRGNEFWNTKQPIGKAKAKELRQRPMVSFRSEDKLKVTSLLESIRNGPDDEMNISNMSNEAKPENYLFSPDFIHNRDPELDHTLLEDFKEKQNSEQYIRMQSFCQKLPSYAMKKEIVDLIKNNRVIVISGETGCGKTTQIPQYILDDFIGNSMGSMCSIVCTQPRRISAISIAERVAQERAEICGHGSVGYLIRLEKKLPRTRGSILYCTTGILLKWLESDRRLSKATHIILDEVHERDILSDFLIIILKDLLTIRSDLKVIIMSATLNSSQFSQYFDNCPMHHIPGFTFPVKQYYLEDILAFTNYKITPRVPTKKGYMKAKHYNYLKKQQGSSDIEVFCRNLVGRYPDHVITSLLNQDEDDELDVAFITELIKYICVTQKDGAILVFLTGWAVISQVHSFLMKQTYFKSGKHLIIPLHSLMPTVNQGEVFNRPPTGVRKIILSTNIAETSITIDDVVYVIDCGKIKLNDFDTNLNLLTLKAEWVSKANALQRKGRAGRVQEGVCYHLYSKYRFSTLVDYQLPEMLRTRLESICLQIKILKLGEIMPFLSKALEVPSPEAIRLSITFLQTLNALDDQECLTALGYHLARLPVDPQTGKMILFGAMFSCLDPVTTVAASLGFKDAFVFPLGKESQADAQRRRLAMDSKSDHIMLVNAFKGWEEAKHSGNEQDYCWENFLSPNTLKLLSNMKKQFAMLLKELNFISVADPKHPASNINSDNVKLIKAIVCAGLYPNVAKIRNPQTKKSFRPCATKVLTSESERATLHPKSVNCHEGWFKSPWIAYHQKIKSTEVYIHDSTMVTPFSLLLFGGKLSMKFENQCPVIHIDDWIKFWCSIEQVELIKELRSKLDELLESKIKNPGLTQWCSETRETKLLEAVIQLLTSEEILTSPLHLHDKE